MRRGSLAWLIGVSDVIVATETVFAVAWGDGVMCLRGLREKHFAHPAIAARSVESAPEAGHSLRVNMHAVKETSVIRHRHRAWNGACYI